MNTDKKILAEANKMFDAVGVTPYEEDSLLIPGLATIPGRDLDDFVRDEDGVLRLPGCKANAQPKLNSLISFIQEQGLTAKIWGPHGLPAGQRAQSQTPSSVRWSRDVGQELPDTPPQVRAPAAPDGSKDNRNQTTTNRTRRGQPQREPLLQRLHRLRRRLPGRHPRTL